MIVDFHTHIFSPRICSSRDEHLKRDPHFGALYRNPKTKLATADQLVASMDTAGVDVSVVCGFGWMDQDVCEGENDYLLEAISRYPRRLVALCSVQPRAGMRAAAEVGRCADAGMKGIGEMMPDGQGYSLRDFDLLDPIMAVVRERGLIAMIHTSEPIGHDYPGKGRTTPDVTFDFVSRFADISIVCAHWGGGLPFYHLIPEIDEAIPNVYYDTAASFLVYRPDIFCLVPNIVGVRRVLFGTDYPLLSQSRFIRRMTALGLHESALDLMLGKNASELLGLSG
ncbi:MAG: amidohydrolase family protein [Dehalococcoidia bacterium]|nr:amidohydrolase family protein [Dehalococcoidia bacterium]